MLLWLWVLLNTLMLNRYYIFSKVINWSKRMMNFHVKKNGNELYPSYSTN